MTSRWSLPLGSILQIPIRVHVLFVLLVALVPIVSWRSAVDGWSALALVLTGLGCLLVHEFGHALMAKRLGIPVRAVVLGPLVNVSILEREPSSPNEESKVAAAGPVMNGVLFGLFAAAFEILTRTGAPEGVLSWCRLMAAFNLLMSLGNLLPAFPLDGGRILRAGLGARWPLLLATRMTVKIGNTLALSIPLLSLLHPVVRHSPALFAAVVAVCALLYRAGRREERIAQIRELRMQVASPEAEISADILDDFGENRDQERMGYRPMKPGQFRHWRKICEEAYRTERELYASRSDQR